MTEPNALQRLGKAIREWPNRVESSDLHQAYTQTAVWIVPSAALFFGFSAAWESMGDRSIAALVAALSLAQIWVMWKVTGANFWSLVERARGQRRSSRHLLLGLSVGLLFFSTYTFGALSAVLHRLDYFAYDSAKSQPNWAAFAELYFWHFLHAIPGLNIPATLNWNVPFRYNEMAPGFLILAYQVFVISSVTRLFGAWRAIAKMPRPYPIVSNES